jgi:hypothetical protein
VSYTVEPLEMDEGSDGFKWHHPWCVKVNGTLLTKKDGDVRAFQTSITAALAGSRYVDEVLRPESERQSRRAGDGK